MTITYVKCKFHHEIDIINSFKSYAFLFISRSNVMSMIS